MKKIFAILFLIVISCSVKAQHIRYREKAKPASGNTSGAPTDNAVPVADRSIKTTAADSASKPVAVVTPQKKPAIKDTVAKVAKTIAVTSDSLPPVKSRAAVIKNVRPKKPFVEPQNMCDLMSRPEVAAQLPMVINKVSPEMVKMLKARYEGRLYSITGLNMIDVRLKFKLKICDKDKGKFRSEYLDIEGNVVNDPDLDYD